MESVTKAIGSAVISFVLLMPIFLLAASIFDKWDYLLIMLFAIITFGEWLACAVVVCNDYK